MPNLKCKVVKKKDLHIQRVIVANLQQEFNCLGSKVQSLCKQITSEIECSIANIKRIEKAYLTANVSAITRDFLKNKVAHCVAYLSSKAPNATKCSLPDCNLPTRQRCNNCRKFICVSCHHLKTCKNFAYNPKTRIVSFNHTCPFCSQQSTEFFKSNSQPFNSYSEINNNVPLDVLFDEIPPDPVIV